MDTNRLRCFSVIAKTESVRRSAEILKLTPSALSKMIKQLEEEMGVSLVVPQGRGIILTPEGREFAKRSVQILNELEDMKQALSKRKSDLKEAPIRVATFEVFSTHFLQILEKVDLGNRKLVWRDSRPGELEQSIADSVVDFGITYLPIPYAGVEHLKITRVVMGVYKRADRFVGQNQEELPFVVPVYPIHGVPNRVTGLDGWPDDAYDRQIQYEVSLMETALEFCRQGLCAGYFPSFVVGRHNQKVLPQYRLVRHPYTKSVKRCYSDVYLVKRRDRNEDVASKWVSKLIRMCTRMEGDL